MNDIQENYKLIALVTIGAIGGLLLGKYIWDDPSNKRTLSNHLSVLSNVLKQFESIDTDEANDIKNKIQNILEIVKQNYGQIKE